MILTVVETYEGKPCSKCGNTERYIKDRHLRCRSICFADRQQGDRQASFRKYNNSIKGYLRERKRYINKMFPLYQQQLEAVRKELENFNG